MPMMLKVNGNTANICTKTITNLNAFASVFYWNDFRVIFTLNLFLFLICNFCKINNRRSFRTEIDIGLHLNN